MCHQYDSPKTQQVPALGATTLICLCVTRHLSDQPSIFPISCHSLRCFQPDFLAICFFSFFQIQQVTQEFYYECPTTTGCMGPSLSEKHAISKRFSVFPLSQQCSTSQKSLLATLFSHELICSLHPTFC